jgi:hypothetical protein
LSVFTVNEAELAMESELDASGLLLGDGDVSMHSSGELPVSFVRKCLFY